MVAITVSTYLYQACGTDSPGAKEDGDERDP